ncbi:hypothetical protein [Pseudogemmobacter hezensis]|uniref:hypothetical protein n=1 Tax=Pseudogemmobacter hezensis TaxID=2737662 RepID=UPI001554A739|nr:hypothetical protein [Pseudogemmobacter hezensis]
MSHKALKTPALPGVTRVSTGREAAPTGDEVVDKQRKMVARILGGMAVPFLIAGSVVNPAFLVIGGFLAFAAFVATRPASGKSLSRYGSPLLEPMRDTWAENEMIPGTPEYEMRHRMMKWD